MLFTIYMPLSLYQYANKTESFPRKENQISLQLAAQLEMILLFFFLVYIFMMKFFRIYSSPNKILFYYTCIYTNYKKYLQ